MPYYAAKCNPNAAIVGALEALGCGFDCASLTEIALAIDQGVSPDRIIYANPFKSRKYLQYARSVGVQQMTFDSIEELKKVICVIYMTIVNQFLSLGCLRVIMFFFSFEKKQKFPFIFQKT